MKINSDFIWALVVLVVATASFFLGMKKESLKTEELFQEKMEEIKVLENKNQQLSEELTSRGIFSYPQATIIPQPGEDYATVLISLNGKDPINNLEVDRNIVYNYSSKEAPDPGSKGKHYDLGNLKPHNPSAFELPLESGEVSLQLEYKSNRKIWHQYIWLRKTAENEVKSFWLITNENSVVIDKHIDPGFPTNSEGKVVLWKGESIHYSDLKMNSTFPPGS